MPAPAQAEISGRRHDWRLADIERGLLAEIARLDSRIPSTKNRRARRALLAQAVRLARAYADHYLTASADTPR